MPHGSCDAVVDFEIEGRVGVPDPFDQSRAPEICVLGLPVYKVDLGITFRVT